MANKSIFSSFVGKMLPKASSRNRAGGPAYDLSPRHKLAQLAVTGTISRTYYANAGEQLDEALAVAREVDPLFVAKTAIYAREKGYMKDMPALLLALLSKSSPEQFARAFPRVVDNGRMLRTFVQIMRSGTTGRKSLGSRPKAMVAGWLATASDRALMQAAVGNDPSLGDIVKMVHPKPKDKAREAFYGWLIGKKHDAELLPEAVQAFERFKRDPGAPVPDVPFQMLTALELTPTHWAAIADKAGWHMLRMNLNTFERQCVFAIDGMAEKIAARLADEREIKRARVFPYQLMAAYAMASGDVPEVVREALRRAMEVALANVPAVKGNVVVCPDVSGSMRSPVTGVRKGGTSAVRCIDVAALVAAAMVAKNPRARVIPFEQSVVDVELDPELGVVENSARLAAIGGGGTNCSAPLELLNKEKAKVDLVLFVSDNQSWVDAKRSMDTGMMREWTKLKARNKGARLVCIDIQPYGTTQAPDDTDILNIGGFSDAVFEAVDAFVKDELNADHFVGEIEKVSL